MSHIPHVIEAYEKYSGKEVLLELAILGNKLSGKKVEVLCSSIKELPESAVKIVGLMNGLGINAVITDVLDPETDYVIVFSQALAQKVKERGKGSARWIWAGEENHEIRQHLVNYDAVLFSSPTLAQHLPVPQYLIPPAIDPLDERNRNVSAKEIREISKKFKIDHRKPLVALVSSNQIIKDTEGVKRAFSLVKKKYDCQLIMLGKGDVSDLEVNVLQRLASVNLQQSYKGSSGIVVAEALWKGRPVVLTASSGSPFQIVHNVSGLLVHSVEGAAYQIRYLLNNPERSKSLGQGGHQYVKENFLIPSALKAYLLVMLAVAHPDWKLIEI
jgi:trehalose synthase